MSDDLVREFLVESNENLDSLDRELVQLETEPTNRDRLASVFRTIHTIKGTCGFLGFTKLESVAHAGENLLSRLRDGHLLLNPEITTTLLQMVDAVRQMLQSIEAIGTEGERHDEALIQKLTNLYQTGLPSAPPAAPEVTAGPPETTGADRSTQVERDSSHPDGAESSAETPPSRGNVSESTIRVDVTLLDKLMTLVGELVLARNQIVQFTNSTDDAVLLTPSQHLDLITTELQESVMKMRMQPIGNIWRKLPRTVRDIAASLGKQIRLKMEGQNTELDKTIIEAIKDPLTHIVRNSADHGIETPEVRVAAGKPSEGRLLLRAYHEGGQVNIEISDDGAGLNADKLRRKAIEKGLMTAEHAARLSDREAANLIFLPGFSTAERVTHVSGRGVGMDVVKTNIEKIGGTVDLYSQPGAGTSVKMTIPLTLAIIPALIVTSGADRYAIPQINLLELVRLEEEEASKQIELIQDAPVYRLRGRLLPLVYLDRELKAEPAPEARNAQVNIVVLQAGERQFGLVVDGISGTEEIVVKPLGKQLKGLKTFAGSTIMGDGRVSLILDVVGLAQSAGVVGEVRERACAKSEPQLATENRHSLRHTLLLFTGPDNGSMAVPLDHVGRLEEFPLSSVENSGSIEVVQYRGDILPLLFLSDVIEERRGRFRRAPDQERGERSDRLQCVVYSSGSERVGLVIAQILDIVEAEMGAVSPPTRAGVLCSAVVHGRVTEILDVPSLLQTFKTRHTSKGTELVGA